MDLRFRPSGLAPMVLAASTLCLSCSGADAAAGETSGGSPAGSGGGSSVAGTTGAGGTTGSTGMSDASGTTGSMGTGAVGNGGAAAATGSVGAGGNAAGAAGTGGGTAGSGETGSGGTAGTGAAGTGATGGTGGTAGGGGTDGGGGTAGGDTMDPAPSAGCGSPAGLTSGRASIDVSGMMREYILLVPDNYDPDHPYRLVFGWHPWGGSAQQTESMGYFGLESVSDGQAILVAPEGLDYQGRGLGWANENGRDIDFYHAMLDRFSSELCIDQNRIFSTGFSFGAMFSFTLACTQDSMLRAIAPQAGNTVTSGGCENGTRSVATMAFIGTEDNLLDGHRQAVDVFVGRDECSTQPVEMESSWCDGLSSTYEPCTCVEYPDCKAGYPVISCEYLAGHQFAPNSGATIWNFFSQF